MSGIGGHVAIPSKTFPALASTPHLTWLLAAGVSGAACLYFGFYGPLEARKWWYLTATAPTLAIVFAALVALGLAERSRRFRSRSAGEWTPWAIGATVVAVLLIAFPPEPRIQADESNLLGTSLGFRLFGGPLMPASGEFRASGEFIPIEAAVDKRGPAFPFLLDLIHRAVGYRPANAFLLNGALGVAALALWIRVLSRLVGTGNAVAATILLAALPTFAFSLSSGGMEMANLFFLVLLLQALRAALEEHDERAAIAALLLGAILAMTRYESALVAIVTALPIIAMLRAQTTWRQLPRVLPLLPLAYLPVATQKVEGFDLEVETIGATEAFSAAHLVKHATDAANFYLFHPVSSGGLPLFGWMALTGLVMGFALRRQLGIGPLGPAMGWWMLGIVAVTAVTWLYAWGDFTHPLTSRLALPLSLLLSVGVAMLIRAFAVKFRSGAPGLALAIGTVMIVSPRLHAAHIAGRESLAGTLNVALSGIREAAGRCRVLVVSPYAQYFIANGYGAIVFENVVPMQDRLEHSRLEGNHDVVLAVESRDPTTGEILHRQGFLEDLPRRTLLHRRVGLTRDLTISLVLPAPGAAVPGCLPRAHGQPIQQQTSMSGVNDVH